MRGAYNKRTQMVTVSRQKCTLKTTGARKSPMQLKSRFDTKYRIICNTTANLQPLLPAGWLLLATLSCCCCPDGGYKNRSFEDIHRQKHF
mmetsp:Transcript_129516/g.252184  ORF Transcript_129516/g.252184 Transcript_129516/m.252184 type:complete len:90 (+) Transcript_129516:17-286(+)